jgi:hypothetical protein
MPVKIETALKPDGRWRAAAPAVRGVVVYAASEEAARARAKIVARHVVDEWHELARDGLRVAAAEHVLRGQR